MWGKRGSDFKPMSFKKIKGRAHKGSNVLPQARAGYQSPPLPKPELSPRALKGGRRSGEGRTLWKRGKIK